MCLLILTSNALHSQNRCGTVEYNQQLRKDKNVIESEQEFEQWLNDLGQKLGTTPEAMRQKAEPYKIRVVVHVIHNGESVGQGANILNPQILSQIDVLNKDFNRLNADATNTPSEFKEVAGNMTIEFVLAEVNPDGISTTGINRVNGNNSSWTIADNAELKALSYWPAENYLNIWVCNLTGYYGFTQFPVSSLEGLSHSSSNRLTDGIIMNHKVFGSSDYGNYNLDPNYNKGRTTTHEVGHFLGLRHIWGDANECNATDYINDTPEQSVETIGCPTHPKADCSSTNKMFQNYMDLTDDVCMNLFTKDQVKRMKIVLENSPRRASLLLPLIPSPSESQFPKVFSPNGDGINDFWLWNNSIDYLGCKLTIFNRFGKSVFEMESYDGSWNGHSSQGQLLEEEAYYYVIRCDGKKEITGGVRIVR